MDENILNSEFGSSFPINFAEGKLYNEEHEEIKCLCGKAAQTFIGGATSYFSICNECMGME